LQGDELEEMFSIADLYVMPSVSEPFGITALEAISFDTPVLISKQSGVAEVLRHALKADFWDVERMADLIINSLLHEELRQEMVTRARDEVRRLHWDAAALKTIEVYQDVGL
jgi:glycosyltransferase involved in cell wall biosynthesis